MTLGAWLYACPIHERVEASALEAADRQLHIVGFDDHVSLETASRCIYRGECDDLACRVGRQGSWQANPHAISAEGVERFIDRCGFTAIEEGLSEAMKGVRVRHHLLTNYDERLGSPTIEAGPSSATPVYVNADVSRPWLSQRESRDYKCDMTGERHHWMRSVRRALSWAERM